MTVTELISRLAQFPPDTEVVCQWWEGQGDIFIAEHVREATEQEIRLAFHKRPARAVFIGKYGT